MAQSFRFFAYFEPWFCNVILKFNSESILTPSNFSWELVEKRIPSIEIFSSFLELSQI